MTDFTREDEARISVIQRKLKVYDLGNEKKKEDCYNELLTQGEDKLLIDEAMKRGLPTISTTKQTTQNIEENRKEILLPTTGRLITEFGHALLNEIKDKNILFFRSEARDIVEIKKVIDKERNKYSSFVAVNPHRFITLVERFVCPGIMVKNKETEEWEFKTKSMYADLANTMLQSHILQDALPRIDRIFPVPIPIIHDDELTFPTAGYDCRFNSWTPHDAPNISNPNMSLEEAKKTLDEIYGEFCFTSPQDKDNAIAGLLTPFLRGLYPQFNTRTPVFIYLGNRERTGKDYCAGITGIVYEGQANEDPPISSSDNSKTNNNEELKKKLLAAMIGGRKRMHFSNNKGYINNAIFEGVVTSKTHTDRILGRNELLTFNNEMDFSLSGNMGVGLTPDLVNRARFVRFFLDIEDANSRQFENPMLHNWVVENRPKILSALYTLVRNWIDKGKPNGTIPFTSFPEWAKICGGIMEAASYLSPCNKDKETLELSTDTETTDMKELFEICYSTKPNAPMTKKEILATIEQSEATIFGYLDMSKKSDITRFWLKFRKYIGRILSDITLRLVSSEARTTRQEFMFSSKDLNNNEKVGYVRLPLATFDSLRNENDNNNYKYSVGETCPNVAKRDQILICPKCNSNDVQTYNDSFVCFNCKHKEYYK